MATVKTAISLEESLLNQVDELAQELEVSRSRVFAMAANALMQQRQNQKLLDDLNTAYSDTAPSDEVQLHGKMRSHHRRSTKGQW